MNNKKVLSTKKKKSKFARVMKAIGDSILESLGNLVKKFKKTSKEFKILLGVWLAVILIIIIVVCMVNANKKTIAKHEKIQSEVKTAALDYVKEKKLYPTSNQKLRLNMEVLIENGNLYKDSISDKTCVGYALVYFDEAKENYVIEPYISCKNYVTEGYEVK